MIKLLFILLFPCFCFSQARTGVIASSVRGTVSTITYLNLTSSIIVCDGNSLTYGYQSSDPATKSYPSVLGTLSPFSTNGTTITNKGVSGSTTEQIAARADTSIDPLYSGSVASIVIAWEITNDIYYHNVPVSAVVDSFWAYCDARRAIGWRVVVLTVIPRNQTTSYGASPTTYQLKIDTANSLIRSGWTSHANGIADVQADSRLGTYTSTYFNSDQTHLNDSGYAVVAGIVKQTLINLPASATNYATYMTAIGGTITTDGDYKVHTFTSGGTFRVIQAGTIGTVEALLVAGGGGGGTYAGGGGGAGGIVHNSAYTVTATSYTITVGVGGITSSGSSAANGGVGGNSVFDALTANGGGSGTGSGTQGGAGGSGGGSGGINVTSAGGTGSQGSNGGGSTAFGGGGGGGGNNSAGTAGSDTYVPGNGGNGTAYSISGTSVTYAGGGGGGTNSGGGTGGTGGGGAGGAGGTNGTNGLGGGGGGDWVSATSGAGGTGVVIIRYRFK